MKCNKDFVENNYNQVSWITLLKFQLCFCNSICLEISLNASDVVTNMFWNSNHAPSKHKPLLSFLHYFVLYGQDLFDQSWSEIPRMDREVLAAEEAPARISAEMSRFHAEVWAPRTAFPRRRAMSDARAQTDCSETGTVTTIVAMHEILMETEDMNIMIVRKHHLPYKELKAVVSESHI